MEKKFKIAVVLMAIPIIGNSIITILCYMHKGPTEFKGYLLGTLLGMFFSVIWLVIAKKVSLANAMVLFTYSLGAFPVKIILFAAFAFGGLYLLNMNQVYFGVSFLVSVFFSLAIEVWFILALNKMIIENKRKEQS